MGRSRGKWEPPPGPIGTKRLMKALKQEARYLTPEELKKGLTLTARELEMIKRAAIKGDRNCQGGLQYLAKVLEYRVEKPEQSVRGDVGVQVVVQTMRKEPYSLPEATTTATLELPMKRGDDDAEQV